jgi:hypothetical protein
LDESSTKEQEDDDAEKGPIDVSGNN